MRNTYLIKYLVIGILFLGTHEFASGKELTLICKEIETDSGRNILLFQRDSEFSITNPRQSCDSSFTYEDNLLPNKKFMISAWPSDENLGLNAQRDIFIAPSKKSEAIYIGAIPVDSTSIGKNTYRSVIQAGGSIYETTYLLTEKSIELKSPSKELVISDSLCIYKTESDPSCQTFTGTFERPLCIYNYSGKKILKNQLSCSELSQGISKN